MGDEWSSSKGGLSTVNRELAKHLASQPEVEVTILLPNYTEEEKQEAAESNVRLATPQAMPGIDPIMRLCFPSEELDIDVVIGHGNKLGVPAHVIAKQRKCKWVHIVHTASEELAMFKKSENAITEGEEKHRIEIDLCKEADIVAAIGPKVTDAISACLRRDNKHVMNITPGIFREFSELKQSIDERTKLQKFCILVFGRGDTEDFELKGYDIAAKAVAGLKDKSYKLIFVGAPKGKGEEIKDKLLECGISPSQLIVRGFIKNRDSLGRLFCEADLAIMPSRTEGFGLTALEALSAGLPILVGGNSGFGQALQTLRSTFVVDSDDPDDWREAIECVSGTPRETRQEQARCLLKSYDEKYQWVKQCEMFVQNLREIRK